MNRIQLSHKGGTYSDISPHEASEILKIRYEGSTNEYWISFEDEYPCLAVMVKEGFGSVTYFAESDIFYQCCGEKTADDIVKFDSAELDSGYTVSDRLALKAAEEFINTGKRPYCVKWEKL